MTVISGDSGVGKTRVLEEVVALFDGIAPAPVVVGHAPAALQAGLLDALGAAAALIAYDEGAARRVGNLLVKGGRRLASAKASEIGLAVARIVLGAVRDRVGKNVTDVIIEYFEQVRDAAADDVVARIRQAGDPDVIHAIASWPLTWLTLLRPQAAGRFCCRWTTSITSRLTTVDGLWTSVRFCRTGCRYWEPLQKCLQRLTGQPATSTPWPGSRYTRFTA